jgi:hypothetical protein
MRACDADLANAAIVDANEDENGFLPQKFNNGFLAMLLCFDL